MITKSVFLFWLTMNYSPMDVAKIDVDQAYCMAQNVYHEARSESIQGQLAVAGVTLNRTKDSRFPNSVCGVVNEKLTKKYCSFSWTCDGKSDAMHVHDRRGRLDPKKWKVFNDVAHVSVKTMLGKVKDASKGANYYYNPEKASPLWASLYTVTCKIGDHVFLKRKKGSLV